MLTLPLTPQLKRLRAVAMTLVVSAYLLSYFHRVAPAVIAQDLAASFHISAASLGVLAATYFYAYTIMQIPAGILADTLGPRKLLMLGGMVAGIGSLMFGWAPTFELAVVGRTMVGFGVSVTFISMLKLIAVWFEENRFATLTGVVMLIGNLGSVVAGTPLGSAAQAVGWRFIFIVAGGVSLLLGVLSWLYVRDSPVETIAPRLAETQVPVRKAWISDLMKVVKNRDTWPGFFANTGSAGSFFAFVGLWAVPYLTQVHGLSRTVASNHLSVYFVGFAIGCMAIGRLSDMMGKRKPLMLAGTTLHALGWLIWIFGGALSLTTTYILCFGMGVVASSLTLSWACAKEVNPPQLSGMATSVVNTGVFLGAAILQPLIGWAMDRSWAGGMIGGARLYSASDYQTGLILLASFAALGPLATVFIKETGCRNIWRENRMKE